jgi:hypothetical protein
MIKLDRLLTEVPGRMKELASKRRKLNNFAERNNKPTPAKACKAVD